MAGKLQYDKVTKYLVTARCTGPLHIGSSTGEKESVLIHPVSKAPFLQASGIAGVFRSYYEKQNGSREADSLFGMMKSKEAGEPEESRVKFTDGTLKNVVLERRPRVSINPATGSCASSDIKGTEHKAGHKFTMEYVGAGALVTFAVYLYGNEKKEELECVFSALNGGRLQLGGQKSNGCGYLSVEQLYCRTFDLTTKEDRVAWGNEDELELSSYEDITMRVCNGTDAKDSYEIVVTGKTENALLVKSLAVKSADGTAYSENIRNAKKEYIVPGSSFKGAIRSQMERIAGYLDCRFLIDAAFGRRSTEEEKGSTGCLYFHDTVVGEIEQNDMVELSHRIHIDKFTGGVMNGGLFSERNVFGNLQFKITVKESDNKDAVCGMLLMTLRDLAAGLMNVGGGYNIGKGFIEVSNITVSNPADGTQAELDFEKGEQRDASGIISKCMKALNKAEEK